jgi:acyl dehydratase
MSVTVSEFYLDDFAEGDVFTTTGYTFTEADIIDFALRFDPQPFHLDTQAAARSPYGGLIASGFQTMAICFRLFIQRGLLTACSIGSPGMDEVRWLAPVRPGDTLHTSWEVLEVRPSRSKPDRGILKARYAAINQHGETVLTFLALHLLARNAGAAGPAA